MCPVHYLNVWPLETACNLHLRDTTHSSSPLTRSSADPTHSHNITQNLEAEEGKGVFRLFSVIYLSNLYTCTQIKSISLFNIKNSETHNKQTVSTSRRMNSGGMCCMSRLCCNSNTMKQCQTVPIRATGAKQCKTLQNRTIPNKTFKRKSRQMSRDKLSWSLLDFTNKLSFVSLLPLFF